MTIKFTMLFNSLSAVSSPNLPIHRTGGWSESWYYPGVDTAAAIAAATRSPPGNVRPPLCFARATLLPQGFSIVGQRVQVVDPPGLSQSLAIQFPGNRDYAADVPQMALLLRTPGVGVRNIRKTVLRGIPDGQVAEGEFQPTLGYQGWLQGFASSLDTWLFRGRDLSLPTVKIITITAAGLITAELPLTLQLNDMVRILKTRDTGGNLRGGRFQVTAIGPGNTNATISGWGFGPCTGGSVRKDAVVYPAVDSANVTPGRIIVKKVGRPFVGYRGRRSRRRT